MSPRASFALASVLAAVGVLLLTATPAFAQHVHVFSTYFGAADSTPANPYPLANPADVAIDGSAGDIYVTDPANRRVEKFDSAGEFILMFGQDVDQTTGGNVCTAESGDTCQAGTEGSSAGEFTTPTFVAVDSSSGPSAGDVYVGDTGDNVITKFDTSGHLIASWGLGGQLTGFEPLYGIAVDPSGNLFVVSEETHWYEQSGTLHSIFSDPRGTSPSGLAVDAEDNLYKIDGNPEVTKFSDTGVDLAFKLDSGPASGLTVDPSSNDLYVVESGGYVNHFAFNCGENCTALDSFGSGNLSGAEGMAISGTSGDAYVANAGNGNVAVFTSITIPDVTTESASNVLPSSATVSGHVAPLDGGEVTACHFEYVTEEVFQSSGYSDLSSDGIAPCSPTIPYSSPTDVSADISDLQSATTYHYRLDAANANGIVSHGQGQTLTTGPPHVAEVSTAAATNVTGTGAMLNGSLNPAGVDAHYYFEYGTNVSYGHTSVTPPGADAGLGSGSQNVSMTINDLQGGTLYHYRIVASNFLGTTFGPDRTLVTFPTLPSIDTTTSSSVNQMAETLEARIDPGGGATVYRFQYGTNTSYGSSTLISESIGSDNADHAVSTNVTDLTPGTTYHYRAVAINFSGTTHGPDQTFTTPNLPLVNGTSATNVTQTTATLSAQINPEFADTTYRFDYGTGPSYDSSAPMDSSVAADDTGHSVRVDLTGLAPATTYHFRVVATNAVGTTSGPDQVFTTASVPTVDNPSPTKCKAGYVRKHSKCVRKRHKAKHHKRSHSMLDPRTGEQQ